MKIIKTAKLKILSAGENTLSDTIIIYNKALSFFINVVNNEWDKVKELTSNQQITFLEKKTHITKNNPIPNYNFDMMFPKFPSYLRRACIMESVGIVRSHKTRYNLWKLGKEKIRSKGKRFFKKPPVLQFNHNAFPVFYKTNMFIRLSFNQAKIKVYNNNDWKWLTITFQTKNLKNRDLDKYKELNPSLIRKGKKFFLHIPYETSVKLDDINKLPEVIIGVDLGLTNSAVCCAMKKDGTVIGRRFINQPIEKDRLKKALNKLSKVNRQSGKCNKPRYWRKINGLQNQISQDTANKIIEFALKYGASIIIFENLDKMRTPKGFYGAKRLRYKLQYWNKKKIQKLTENKAHRNRIRISRVLARGTSQYAYDGSGKVERNGKKDICVFSSGKIYHADLNACYNIASRFYTRFYLKPLSEMLRLQVKAKVPFLVNRSSVSLSSLISLMLVLK